MAFSAVLTRDQLRVLNIYRRVPYTAAQLPSTEFLTRWRRVCEEMGYEITRRGIESTGIVFTDLAMCVATGHLDGTFPSFSLYRLTEQGNALLDRWKKAGHP